jgi:cysteine desulfurase
MNIYFDHNATTPVLSEVTNLLMPYFNMPLNPSSIHKFGRNSRSLLEEARAAIALSMNAKLTRDDYDIIFTSSGTETNNLIINNFAGKPIIISAIEHPSVKIAAEKHSNCIFVKVDENGKLDINHLEQILSQQTTSGLVSVMFANNETGVIQDIKLIADITHKYGFYLHTDCSQAYGKIAIDITDLNIDFATISGHKSGAMTGVAALIMRSNFDLQPMIIGGGQEKSKRSGTENLLAIISLGMVAKIIDQRISFYQSLEKYRNYLEQEIAKICDNVVFFSAKVARLPNTSYIAMPNVKNDIQLIHFDLSGIAISSGSACSSGKVSSSHVLTAMGYDEQFTSCAVRVSLGTGNSKQDIEKFIKIWGDVYNLGEKI